MAESSDEARDEAGPEAFLPAEGTAEAAAHPRTILAKALAERPERGGASNAATLPRVLAIAAVFSSGLLALRFGGWLGLPYATLAIGLAQYHLIVSLHESYHAALFRPKWLNDAFGRATAAAFSFDWDLLQKRHMTHHKLFGFPDDPDRPNYALEPAQARPHRFLAELFLRPLLRTLEGRGQPTRPADPPSARTIVRVVLAQAFLFGLFWAVGGAWYWYFFGWAATLVFVPGALQRLREIGEHGGMTVEAPNRREQYSYARSNIEDRRGPLAWPSIVEKWVLAPFHFNHHHEHHLLASAPWHTLPALHRRLRETGYYERNPKALSRSYFRSIRGFLASLDRKARAGE